VPGVLSSGESNVKVSELIAILKDLDQEARIVTRGYEGGYLDPDTCAEMTLVLNVNNAWYYGPHEAETEYNKDEHKDKERVKAYYLG
jgi:hypothetical protein